MEHLFTKRQYATHYCIHCGKSYIKRINLDKHIIICDTDEIITEVKKEYGNLFTYRTIN